MKFDGSGLLNQAIGSRAETFAAIVILFSRHRSSFRRHSNSEWEYNDRSKVTIGPVVDIVSRTNNFSDDEYKLGVEYAYQDILFLRGGYNLATRNPTRRDLSLGQRRERGIHYPLGSSPHR